MCCRPLFVAHLANTPRLIRFWFYLESPERGVGLAHGHGAYAAVDNIAVAVDHMEPVQVQLLDPVVLSPAGLKEVGIMGRLMSR